MFINELFYINETTEDKTYFEAKRRRKKTRRRVYAPVIYGWYGFPTGDSDGGGDGGGLEESLNQPYKLIGWDDESYYDEIRAWAALPDGTYLEILFDRGESEDWQVDFKRGDSMQKTGQGDAQRIFATVLETIRQFIKKYDPDSLSFSAIKMHDPTGSRSRLYDALAKKYAAGLGYSFNTMDDTFDRNYVFRKIQRGVADGRLIK
jgi:hypothetical protein